MWHPWDKQTKAPSWDSKFLALLGALSNLWTVSPQTKTHSAGSKCWAGTLPPLNPVPAQVDGRKAPEQGAPWWWNSQEGGSWEALSKHGYSLELIFFLGTLREGMTLGPAPQTTVPEPTEPASVLEPASRAGRSGILRHGPQN